MAERFPNVELPQSKADVPGFLTRVNAHPDTIEVSIRLAGMAVETAFRLSGGQPTDWQTDADITQWSSLRHGALPHLSASRRAKHTQIVDSLIHDGSRCRTGKPVAVILLGPPGAGKTTCGVEAARQRFGVPFTSVNPDDVKEKLPEYDGWNAGPLHAESSYVSEAMIKSQAVSSRCNIIYDITGRREKKVREAVEELADAKYRVYVVLVDLPPWQAVGRVWSRFQENPFGRVDVTRVGSRYVQPEYAYYAVGDLPRKTYHKVKDHPRLSGYCLVDARVPVAQQPAIQSRGKDW